MDYKKQIVDLLHKVKVFAQDNFILLYAAISFICFAFILNTCLFTVISVNEGDFFSVYKIILFPEKRIELLSYLLTVPILFGLLVLYFLLYLNINKIKNYFSELTPKIIFSLLPANLAVNLLICFKLGNGLKYTLVIFLIWTIMFILPLYFIKNLREKSINIFNKFFDKPLKCVIITSIVVFSIINLFTIFKPFVFKPLFIYNEVNLIPIETILYDMNKKPVIVDNNAFKEKNNINGFRKNYDIRYPNRSLGGENCVSVSNLLLKDKMNKLINDFYNNTSYKFDGIINYFYIADNKVCYINELTKKDVNLFKDNIEKKYWKDIDNLYYSSKELYTPKGENLGGLVRPDKSEAELLDIAQFKKANNFNDILQNVTFWINHQNHILSTISQLNLGRNPNDVFMQYGYGTTLLLQKMLNLQNGFNFQDYYHSINVFYYIYYVALFALMFLLFRNPVAVTASYSLLLIALNKFMYIHYHIAPGANPLRHFFDVFVIGFLFYYFKTKNKWLLVFADLCCIGGIFLYPSYGIMLALSMVAMSVISYFIQKDKFELNNASVLFVTSLFAYKFFNIGLNYGMDNYLYGLSGFLATKYGLMLIYALVIFSYILILKNIKTENQENILYRNLLLLLTLYSQGMTLYFLTISEITHFLVIAPIYILTLFVFGKLLFLTFNIKVNQVVQFLLLVYIFHFSVATYMEHMSLKKGYLAETKAHPVYEWKMPHSNFTSNMNPKYFEDSIALLQNEKYSKTPEIYIISQYDSLLTLLSDKYNALPYIEVQWYMTKLSIFKSLQEQLEQDKPQYIFVDNVLAMDNLEALLDKDNFRVKLQMYQRLVLLRSLFETVKKDYKPVESSQLITVWERIK